MATSTTPGGRRHERWLGAVLLAVMVVATAQLVAYGYGRDQGIYAVVGRVVLDGGAPYRDAFDFKPPGIFLVFALGRALLGPAQWAIRVLEAVGLGLSVVGLVVLARRFWGDHRIGWIAGALGTLVHAQLDFWHTAQPETFGGFLIVAAVVVGTHRWPGHPGPIALVGAGILLGAAGLLKPPLAGAGVVLGLWAGWRLRAGGARWAHAARPLGWILAGGVVPFVACLFWLWAKGALPAAREALLVFVPPYTALGWAGRSLPSLLADALARWLLDFGSLLTAGLLLGAWPTRARRDGVGLIAGIVAVLLVGVALQAKFFPYHFGACWPLTALLAALGWWRLWQLAAAQGTGAVAALLVGVVLLAPLRTATKDFKTLWWLRAARRTWALAGGLRDQASLDALDSVADVDAAVNRRVALRLRGRLPPGAPLYVWGFEPVLYDLTDRPAASRFIYNVPQRVPWAQKATRAELMSELAAHPPGAIVVAHGDPLHMVTGNRLDSATVLERDFAELSALLRRDYAEPTRCDDMEIYFRR